MALKFFDDNQSSGSGNLEFLNDWIEKNPKNKDKEFPIEEVVRVQSGKGYLLKTEKFAVFLFKNQKIAKQLTEALDTYVNELGYGWELLVFLPKPNKPDFKIACNDEKQVTWFTSKNGYTTLEDLYTSQTSEDTNPFLPTKT